MPYHDFFGNYELDDDGTCEFAPLTLNGSEVELNIYRFDSNPTQNYVDTFATFCKQLSKHEQIARTHLTQNHNGISVAFVDDLMLSNPELDILGELFPEEADLKTTDALTPAMLHKAIQLTNCMMSIQDDDPPSITLDLTFPSIDMHYLFACKFNVDGKLLDIDIES